MPDRDLMERLVQHRTLGNAPREELEWLAAHRNYYEFSPGDLLDRLPHLSDHLGALFYGHYAIYVDHGAGPHKVMEWSGGDVTGYLPYSRMNKVIGDMVIDEGGDVLVVHSQHFPELIRECPMVTTKLVHVMLDR